MSLQVAKHFFTVEQFERMGEAGILTEDARFELIEGEILEMAPIGSRHAGCVLFLSRFLNRAVGDIAFVSTQNPIQLDDFTQPQPDVALLRLSDDFYRSSHPKPQDVLLLIEVADTTVDYDRLVKLPLYAKAGIPEVWIINLPAELIEIYSAPNEGAYGTLAEVKRSEQAQSQTISSLSIPADMILG
ncbi:MAG TPA: Uma2 family endonuclease [Pyrinomonadaceae bacterium]|nr:Uma2 family endonuclease [Pyrinomonadaceae bacterium]